MKWSLTLLILLVPVLNLAQQHAQSHDENPRWKKAQQYAADGFEPLDCFAGQVRVRGKRVTHQTFSLFLPNTAMTCCGALVKSGRTDQHGHFLIEPLQEGKYFAQFNYRGTRYVTNFAIVQSYDRCDGTHVEMNFSDPVKTVVKTFVDINDSGEPCQPDEPHCYRK